MESKQVLSIEQMQHLQELGMKLDYNTMLSWIVDDRGKDKPLLCISSEALDYVDFNHYCLPAYTLQDVLDALPEYIYDSTEQYLLEINMFFKYIRYSRFNDVLTKRNFDRTPIIDAAYELLVWCIENKFVETDKNE